MNKERFSHSKIKAAIKGSGGVKLRICKAINISRPHLDHLLKKWPDLQAAIEAEKEDMVDMYESTLHTIAIKEKDIKAIMFYLRYSKAGRNRGYGIENETPKGGNVNAILEGLANKIEQGGDE